MAHCSETKRDIGRNHDFFIPYLHSKPQQNFTQKNILCGKTRMVVSTRMVKKFEDMSTDFDRIHKPGAGSVRRVELLFLA